MDCTNARLLLGFARTGEIDAVERDALESHLAGCSDCAVCARSESQFDDALEMAMPRVAVPAGLRTRILERLAKAPRPRAWRWATAAALVLATGLAGFIFLTSGPEEIEFGPIAEKIDIKATPDAVEAAFLGWGVDMAAPREFNFDLLDATDVAEIQGRRVAKLTFLSQGDGRAALAHVYVLQAAHFKLPASHHDERALKNGWLAEVFIPASTHNVQVLRYANVPEFFFLVVYSSRSLEPFLLRGV
jgi:hypothetical protein